MEEKYVFNGKKKFFLSPLGKNHFKICQNFQLKTIKNILWVDQTKKIDRRKYLVTSMKTSRNKTKEDHFFPGNKGTYFFYRHLKSLL